MRVKVCGITSLSDAQMAIAMGACALGFNFYPKSSRYIDPKIAHLILQQLPKTILTVGIFVNASLPEILAIQQQTKIQMVQLHGNELLAFCEQMPVPVIKAIRPSSMDELEATQAFTKSCILLIDAPHATEYGGTGRLADWSIAKALTKQQPIILAGGLNPENVIDAIHAVQPNMLDVCSGVEIMPGKKSLQKMELFFSTLRVATIGSF